jgi:hypothetical protein
MKRVGESTLYEFRVRGALSNMLLTAFPDLEATTREGGETILTGQVPDQAALFGVLDRIQALGLHLVEVKRAQPAD